MKVRRKEMEGKNGGKAPSWCVLSVGHCAYIIFTFHRLQSSTSMWPAILYINKVGHVDVDDSWGLFTCADVNDAVVIVVWVISAATSGCSKFLASTPPTSSHAHVFLQQQTASSRMGNKLKGKNTEVAWKFASTSKKLGCIVRLFLSSFLSHSTRCK